MKWVSFIFRHGLLVTVVVGIAIAYVYRYQLFPRFFEQDDTTKVVSVDTSKEEGVDAKKLPDQKIEGKQTVKTPTEIVATTAVESANTSTEARDIITNDDANNSQVGKASVALEKNITRDEENKKSSLPRNEQITEVKTLQAPSHADQKVGMHREETALDQTSVKAVDDKPTTSTAEVSEKKQGSKGFVSDPMNTMTGMMRKPSQSLSGIMNDPVQSTQQMMAGSPEPQTKQTPPATSPNAQAGFKQQPMTSQPQSSQRPMSPATGSQQQPRQDYRQLLSLARQAYWQGQYKQSVTYYKQAIEADAANPDTYGELGNLYYAQGMWDKSGESLYQSAIRWLDVNRPDKAHNLLSVIRGLKHKRGDELEERLKKFQGKPSR